MNTSTQFYYPEFGIPSYLIVLLSAFPFSIFLITFAINQSDIISFYIYVYTACIIVGLPFMATLNRENTALQSVKKPVQERGITAIQQRGNHKDWQWRGWKVRYTFVSNPKSQLSVILLHGFGASIGHWRQNIPELAKYYNVYALDLLGFGASTKPDISYSVGLWVEQVYEFWQTFIKEPTVLVGNSIGSVTCLATAAAHPEMVRGVAMISLPDTSSTEELIPKPIRPLINRLKRICSSPLLLQPLFYLLRYPCILRHWLGMAYARKEAITEELIEILSAPARDRYSARAFCAIIKAMLSPQFYPCIKSSLSSLEIPSLLLWGKGDRMIPPTLSKRFLNYNPALQLIEVENAGHCAHDEHPEQVNRELLLWIQTEVLKAL
ncbi:alpha/beta fold hydrolase [Chlorogloeopsis fritschii PCC 9212]|uniref:Alpha/beta hydrolase n=1 Tax=Chlorogloeopsis fritschii PCC 6912 TaxID=211165 RepID=A0A3S1AM56_CHLFR|nr:alpha/beta fold hydrolase [Chlorogloeopsis fritschii]RUR84510.1 alpha/beta hydrolase [Chlorogloeopsis fritschii PCC 6912]